MEKKVLTMPIKEEDVRELKLGDVVYLTGHIFTSRDMGHLRIRQLLEKGEPLPKDFNGAAIFHAGPVCLKNEDGSWRLNVIGPTTSIRMEPYADMVTFRQLLAVLQSWHRVSRVFRMLPGLRWVCRRHSGIWRPLSLVLW